MATTQREQNGTRSCPHCGTQPMHVLASNGECQCLDCGSRLE